MRLSYLQDVQPDESFYTIRVQYNKHAMICPVPVEIYSLFTAFKFPLYQNSSFLNFYFRVILATES